MEKKRERRDNSQRDNCLRKTERDKERERLMNSKRPKWTESKRL